jgi:spore germination cell wall hydrolase CwlJ-like protein
MSVLKSWTGGAVLLLALAGGLRAEVTVSQSNDPNEVAEQGLLSLMVQERSALGAVTAERATALTKAPAKAAKKGEAPEITAAWLAEQPKATGGEQFQCLAQVLYFEARGETLKGQRAVAEVVLNRVDDPAFPNTICGVVYQSNSRGCQFSWTCDGRADKVGEQKAFNRVAKVARAMMDGAPRSLTEGATFFHTPAVKPGWARKFERTAEIGAHIFYRKPVRTASN